MSQSLLEKTIVTEDLDTPEIDLVELEVPDTELDEIDDLDDWGDDFEGLNSDVDNWSDDADLYGGYSDRDYINGLLR